MKLIEIEIVSCPFICIRSASKEVREKLLRTVCSIPICIIKWTHFSVHKLQRFNHDLDSTLHEDKEWNASFVFTLLLSYRLLKQLFINLSMIFSLGSYHKIKPRERRLRFFGCRDMIFVVILNSSNTLELQIPKKEHTQGPQKAIDIELEVHFWILNGDWSLQILLESAYVTKVFDFCKSRRFRRETSGESYQLQCNVTHWETCLRLKLRHQTFFYNTNRVYRCFCITSRNFE